MTAIRFVGPVLVGPLRTSKLFLPGGDVRQWCQQIAFEVETRAAFEAPTSAGSGRPYKTRRWAGFPSGSLKASIGADVTQPGTKFLIIKVKAGGPSAPYAPFVIEGTRDITGSRFQERYPAGTYIDGKAVGGQYSGGFSGRGMVLPSVPGKFDPFRGRSFGGNRPIWVFARRGQAANNFLVRGYEATSRAHAGLPPGMGVNPY